MKIITKTQLEVKGELKELNQVLSHFDQIYQPWIPKYDWLQCQLALAEGFTNAVRHAHKNLSEPVSIEIELTLTDLGLEMKIWDHGPPFDLEAFIQDLSEHPQHKLVGGQGIPILKKIADDLSYLRTEDQRNCLLIIKNFHL